MENFFCYLKYYKKLIRRIRHPEICRMLGGWNDRAETKMIKGAETKWHMWLKKNLCTNREICYLNSLKY